ncbi:MAG TPA: efflux RND transporter periplasmic adaptor subunit [Candidatus Edwardsbacteria bacterium]|nr:efflux RND transporter periplasmic adaptor subunit [Candidatus Edwardsbacteria bacterium]
MALALTNWVPRLRTAVGNMSWRKRALLGLAGLAVIVLIIVLLSRLAAPAATVKLAAVSRGSLRTEITASGTVQPNNTVEVGTQVSGTINKIFVDYNSPVRQGQVIALLDTTFLGAAAADARSSLQRAEAQLTLAAGNKRRADSLYGQQLISQADHETAIAQYEAARADRNSSAAQLERAQINLAYATIRSPIDGIVISRNIEVGQTVAASLNTPTLFVIADDLRKMQVSAAVDEGDIGKVAVGQRVAFTVDAYPDLTFDGTVSKIYLQPTTVQNVVSYTTIIAVANKDRKLLPGMTANITVITQQVDDALLVPAAALSFQPAYVKRTGSGARADSARAGRANAAARQWAGRARPPADSARGGRPAADSGARGQRPWGSGGPRVFVVKDKKPQRVPVQVLLNNGISAAVVGALSEGDSVAVGYSSLGGKAKAAVNPFQQQRPGGTRGR